MEHGILTAKLCELDSCIGTLHKRISQSEKLSTDKLAEEIINTKKECQLFRATSENKLQCSKALSITPIKDAYNAVEEIIDTAIDADRYSSAEDKLLIAEFSLDIAIQAAERAVLLSMEAIKTEKEERQ